MLDCLPLMSKWRIGTELIIALKLKRKNEEWSSFAPEPRDEFAGCAMPALFKKEAGNARDIFYKRVVISICLVEGVEEPQEVAAFADACLIPTPMGLR